MRTKKSGSLQYIQEDTAKVCRFVEVEDSMGECNVIHGVPQNYWDLGCSAGLLGACFQAERRGCSSVQRGAGSTGRLGSPQF